MFINNRTSISKIKRALVAFLICLSLISLGSILFERYYVPIGGSGTWKEVINKILNTVISPFRIKKPTQSIILSLDGLPSELYKKASDFQSKNNFTESLPLLLQAYDLADKLYGSDNEKTIFLLSELAKCYKTLGHNVDAAKSYQEVLDSMTRTGVELANTLDILYNLNSIYLNVTFDFTKALPVQTRIVSIEEHLDAVTKFQLAQSTGNLGWVKHNLGQFNDAISLDNKALALFDQVQATESVEAIMLRNNLALSYIAIRNNEAAMFFLEEALHIQKKKGKLEFVNGFILINMALISRSKGEYHEAVNLQEKALIIFSELEPKGGGNTVATLDSLIDSYRDLDDAMNLLHVLKKRATILKNLLGVTHQRTINAIVLLAWQLGFFGKYEEALAELKLINDFSEKYSSFNELKISSILLKGLIYSQLGDFNTSNKIAKDLSQKVSVSDSFIKIKYATSVLHLIHVSDINYPTSYSELLQDKNMDLADLKFDRTDNDDANNASTLQLLLFDSSRVKLSQNKPIEATALEARALVLSYIYMESIRDTVAEKLRDISYTMYKLNPSAAIALSKMGVNISQSLKGDISTLDIDTLQSYGKKIKYRYQELAEMLAKQGRLAEAQEVMGFLKLNEFYKYTRGSSDKDPLVNYLTYTPLEQDLITSYKAIIDKIINQNKKLHLLKTNSKTQSDKNLTEALVKQLKKNQEDFIVYIKNMAENVSKKSTVEIQSTADSLAHFKQLQEMIKSSGSDVALLRYYLTQDSLGVIITGANEQFSKSVSIDNTELNKKIADFNQLLRNPKLDPRQAAEELYKLVFEPVVGDLEKIGAKTIMLSLDGVLRYIPFAALYDGKQYLVEKYRLPIYTSAASDKLTNLASSSWQVSAMGVTQSIRDFPSLPGVKAEIEGIVRHGSEGILPGQILLDKSFTSLALQEATKQNYQVLHIASHFVFSPGTEVNSFLLMGDGQELTLGDIRTQNFDFSHVDLLTLSACETGMGGGVDDDGREIEGFGVTAQRQGAKSVLATLWPVADKSTAILMEKFYRLHQYNSLSKAEALREAQLTLLHGNDNGPLKSFTHPFYWAPFILMGNWK